MTPGNDSYPTSRAAARLLSGAQVEPRMRSAVAMISPIMTKATQAPAVDFGDAFDDEHDPGPLRR